MNFSLFLRGVPEATPFAGVLFVFFSGSDLSPTAEKMKKGMKKDQKKAVAGYLIEPLNPQH